MAERKELPARGRTFIQAGRALGHEQSEKDTRRKGTLEVDKTSIWEGEGTVAPLRGECVTKGRFVKDPYYDGTGASTRNGRRKMCKARCTSWNGPERERQNHLSAGGIECRHLKPSQLGQGGEGLQVTRRSKPGRK